MKARQRLMKAEFFDVYGISLLADKVEEADKEYLTAILNPIAEKYRDITLYALRTELRHFLGAGADGDEGLEVNRDLVKCGVTTWNYEVRKTLPIPIIVRFFEKGSWHAQYGGEAWKDIAVACQSLVDKLPATRDYLNGVVAAIDRLNDLEHNNNFYLATYSTFNLAKALDTKMVADPKEIFSSCSREVWKLARDYRTTIFH